MSYHFNSFKGHKIDKQLCNKINKIRPGVLSKATCVSQFSRETIGGGLLSSLILCFFGVTKKNSSITKHWSTSSGSPEPLAQWRFAGGSSRSDLGCAWNDSVMLLLGPGCIKTLWAHWDFNFDFAPFTFSSWSWWKREVSTISNLRIVTMLSETFCASEELVHVLGIWWWDQWRQTEVTSSSIIT